MVDYYVLTGYGAEYVQYSYTCISSITKTSPESKIIFIHKFTSFEQALIGNISNNIEFYEAPDQYKNIDVNKTISFKINNWNYAFKFIPDSANVVFLDLDIIMLSEFDVPSGDIDLILTRTTGKYYINTGLVYCVASSITRDFFGKWKELTNAYIEDVKLYRESLAMSGGVDQHSIIALLELNRDIVKADHHKSDWNDDGINVSFYDASRFNLTTSNYDETNDLVAVHIKSGFRKTINTFSVSNTDSRADVRSAYLYQLWNLTYLTSLNNSFKEYVKKTICIDDGCFLKSNATIYSLSFSGYMRYCKNNNNAGDSAIFFERNKISAVNTLVEIYLISKIQNVFIMELDEIDSNYAKDAVDSSIACSFLPKNEYECWASFPGKNVLGDYSIIRIVSPTYREINYYKHHIRSFFGYEYVKRTRIYKSVMKNIMRIVSNVR